MKGLVDYGGSSSEGSDSDAEEDAPTTGIGAELRARIPEARRIQKPDMHLRESDQAASDTIPKRHDWELEIEKELKKGAGGTGVGKAASNEKRPRARIPALPNFNFSATKDDEVEAGGKKAKKVDDGREEGSIAATSSSTSSELRHGLLALLPQPKSKSSLIAGLNKPQSSAKPVTILLPPSVAKVRAPSVAPRKAVSPPQIVLDDDEEEEGTDGEDDYFGLKSSLTAGIGPSTAASYTLPPINPHVFMDDAEAGPSRPMPLPEIGPHLPSAGEPSPSSSNQRGKRGHLIDDHEASRLIYTMELAPFGVGSKEEASLAVESMVEVSVDQALGPNVRENLLRNLNNKSMAQVAAGPLPKVKKDPQMKLAKMKHQITHLAGLAVSREEQLQEKWAENRAKKKQSAQRYGF